MTRRKLPIYFKEYLDEKFNYTFDKIKGVDSRISGVKKEVCQVKEELKRMNGTLASTKTKVDTWEKRSTGIMTIINQTKTRSKKNKKRITYLAIVVVFGVLISIKETRDVGVTIITALLRAL